MRTEDRGKSFRPADLSEESLNRVKRLEESLAEERGRPVVVVAYESDEEEGGQRSEGKESPSRTSES